MRLDVESGGAENGALQAGKLQEIPVERHPLATPFDRERGVPGVRYLTAARARVDAEFSKNVPVAGARFNDFAMRLHQQVVAETEGFFE